MRRTLLLLLLFTSCAARPQGLEDAPPAVSLQELAAAADLVALAQVRDTDYRRQRDIPISGSAFLKVLIPYKTDRPAGLIEVYEKGLHAAECYFPNPTVLEEGRRYLVFLRRDPDAPERYRGLPEGCAMDVLVARDNRYALRYPPSGFRPDGALAERARPMLFADRYAVVADDELPPAERNALRDGGYIEPAGDGRWRFTRGVELSAVRGLLGTGATRSRN